MKPGHWWLAATLVVVGTGAAGLLSVGYYDALEDAEIVRVYFLKKSPTPRTRFANIFANDADDKPLDRLGAPERREVIAYCRYRLGIVTDLATQRELDRCKQR